MVLIIFKQNIIIHLKKVCQVLFRVMIYFLFKPFEIISHLQSEYHTIVFFSIMCQIENDSV